MTLSINFRKKQQARGTKAWIYCRIRLNGRDATDFSTNLPSSDEWDQSKQMFVGKGQSVRDANTRLAQITDDLYLLSKELLRENLGYLRASDLRNTYVKRAEKKSLLSIFDDHLRTIEKNLGAPAFSTGTLRVHKTHTNVLKAFLKFKKREDIDLLELRESFGTDFINWMRQVKKYHQNYIVRNLNHLKSRIERAEKDGYLRENPFENLVESKLQPGPIEYLTEKELKLLEQGAFLTDGLRRVTDAFLFQCFTGLAYIDLKRFDSERHVTEIQGRTVIRYARNKTDTPFMIPLLEIPAKIIAKYEGQIPVISNQKMNEYIKIVAKTVGINKHITTHLGRKTAGTYLLNNDVPMTTVSRILAHRSVRTTEKVYAHLFNETILRHTAHLK